MIGDPKQIRSIQKKQNSGGELDGGCLEENYCVFTDLGEIISGNSQPGYFKPSDAQIKFAVPHLAIIRDVPTAVPTELKPGVTVPCLDAIADSGGERATYNLSFDEKNLISGLLPRQG